MEISRETKGLYDSVKKGIWLNSVVFRISSRIWGILRGN